ncbi:MAG: hypothetical protein J6C56_03750 [Alistipes sp.]|nr:hypothetical protein [Alistipes sp.]
MNRTTNDAHNRYWSLSIILSFNPMGVTSAAHHTETYRQRLATNGPHDITVYNMAYNHCCT